MCMCPPRPFPVGTEPSARLQSHFVLVRPMQISSKIPLVPVPQPVCSESLPCRDQCTARPGGEWVQGNEPLGNYLLVWDGFCCLSSPNQLPAEGGQVPTGKGWDAQPGLRWRLGFPVIPAELRIQEISHIWRELFPPHLPYPTWGCNEAFHMLVLSILFPCRTAPEECF